MAINLNGTGSITGLSSISSPTISGGSFPAGTAAAPGITLSGDSDTGLYSPGANQIAITTSGTAAVTVDASQRVGIGTSSVTNNVNVDIVSVIPPATDAYSKLQLRAGNYGYIIEGGLKQGHGSQLRFNISDDGSTKMMLDAGGRLLVGTSSSSLTAKFVVQARTDDSTGNGAVVVQRGSTPSAADETLGAVQFTDSSGNYGAWILGESDGGGWTSGSNHRSRLVFSVTRDGQASPTETFRISNGGQAALFSTTNNYVAYTSQGAGTTNWLFYGGYGSTSITSATTQSFGVYTNGNVVNTNNSYGALSDAKLKENIVDANSQWDDIKALRPVNYNFKEGQTHTQLGLIAQEVELVSPGLVTESPDRDAEGNDLGTVTKSVNYSVLYMKAVKALQEAMERIEQLETEMAEVKAQLS